MDLNPSTVESIVRKVLGEMSGASTPSYGSVPKTAKVAMLTGTKRIEVKDTIDKTDELVVTMRRMVDELYANGRNTVMGDEELEIMVRRCDVSRYEGLLFHRSK